jgi:hypothetical protein
MPTYSIDWVDAMRLVKRIQQYRASARKVALAYRRLVEEIRDERFDRLTTSARVGRRIRRYSESARQVAAYARLANRDVEHWLQGMHPVDSGKRELQLRRVIAWAQARLAELEARE